MSKRNRLKNAIPPVAEFNQLRAFLNANGLKVAWLDKRLGKTVKGRSRKNIAKVLAKVIEKLND